MPGKKFLQKVGSSLDERNSEGIGIKGRDQGLASDARGAFLLSDLLSPRYLICKIVMVVILSI